jgi:hypothetical protein
MVCRFQAALVWCVLGSGCGADGPEVTSVAASLLIPRQLAEEIETVAIYAIELKNLQPSCIALFTDPAELDSASVASSVESPFNPTGTNQIILDGIPVRGAVWRFYARGLDSARALVAHGCDPGQYAVDPDNPIALTLRLCDSAQTTCN